MARAKKQAEPAAPATEERDDDVVVERAPEGMEIDLDEDDDEPDDDSGVQATPQAPGVRPSKARRGQQYRELETRVETAEREAREAREEASRARQEASQRQQYAPPGQAPRDPDDDRWNQLATRGEELIELFNAKVAAAQREGRQIAPDELARLKGEANNVLKEQQMLSSRMALRQNAPDEQTQRRSQLMQQVQSRYPDVTANQQAFGWALARAQQLMAEGIPNSWEMSDQVMEEARQKFNIGTRGRRAPPNPNLRGKLTGMPRGGGDSSGGQKRTFFMDEKHMAMADEMFPHLPLPNRYKHYARRIAARQAAKASNGKA